MERITQTGPHLEIEEGLCNLAARGLGALEEYPNALNAALLAMLIGMPAEGMSTPATIEQAYNTGLRELGIAFVLEKNFDRIERNISLRYGPHVFDRICKGTFQHSNGATWMTFELLATLEQNGTRANALFEMLENNLPKGSWSAADPRDLQRTTQVLINTLDLGNDQESSKLAQQILNTYPDHPSANLLRWYCAQAHFRMHASASAYAYLETAINSDRHDLWWARCVLAILVPARLRR
jgi:hypothetical protein